jgi:signal recognition particle subunit SRP54
MLQQLRASGGNMQEMMKTMMGGASEEEMAEMQR